MRLLYSLVDPLLLRIFFSACPLVAIAGFGQAGERMKRHGIRSLPTPGDQADPDAVAADVHVDGDSLSELHGSAGTCGDRTGKQRDA